MASILLDIFTDPRCTQHESSLLALLTVRDLIRVAAVSASIRTPLRFVELLNVKGCRRSGGDSSTPWPGLPGLFRTKSAIAAGFGLFAHQIASLRALTRAESRNVGFGEMRGGIFGDAPGLGKTVTALALIVSTSGVRAQDPLRSMGTRTPFDSDKWRALAREGIMMTNRGPGRGINQYRNTLRDASMCSHPDYKACSTLLGKVHGTWRSPRAFEADMRAKIAARLRGARVGERARMNAELRRGTAELRVLCSDLTRLGTAERCRLQHEARLRATSATLVVVPDPLLEHWFQTVRVCYCAARRSRAAVAPQSRRSAFEVSSIAEKKVENVSHFTAVCCS